MAEKLDPYARGKHSKWPFPEKVEVQGHMVVISKFRGEDRGLELIVPYSRVVPRYDIHELMLTDEESARPGATVQRMTILGFFQVDRGGVLSWGDEVWIGNQMVGELAGFDLTHLPNHLNIVLVAKTRLSGVELGLKLGDSVSFKGPGVVELPDPSGS